MPETATIVESAPSTAAPEAATEVTTPQGATADAPASSGGRSDDSIYDEAMANLMREDSATETAAPTNAKAPAQEPEAKVVSASTPLSDAEKQVLARAGLTPEDLAALPAAQAQKLATWAQQQQSHLDRLGAEAARAAQTKTPEGEQAAKPSAFATKMAELKGKMVETYDEDIAPLCDTLVEMETAFSQQIAPIASQMQMLAPMSDLLLDLAIDASINTLSKDYPSASTPQGREQLVQRFQQEWATGTYAKPGTSLRSALQSALVNAAKVTFTNTTEASAAASLVSKNAKIVQSQPKVGSAQAPSRPLTKDDVYAQAFEEFLAPGR